MAYNLPINGVYWGYNPLTNLLLSSWDIQVAVCYPATFPWKQTKTHSLEVSKKRLPLFEFLAPICIE